MTEAPPLRIGIWCAVSSAAQAADDRISLEEQERAGREFAASVNGEVVAVYRVPGHTRDLVFWQEAEAAMPAYRYLREDMEAGRLDVLWNADLDRLGRDPALIHQVISLVEKAGAEVYTASTPHPLGHKSPGFRYVSAIQAVRAGEDQAQRVARHKMGMKGRIVKRGLIAGAVPLGYRPVRSGASGEVIGYEFSEEIGAVELITDLFLSGLSYRRIARELNQSAWAPPGGGQHWHAATVQRIALNDTYAGYPSWGNWRATEPSGAYPALWSTDQFARIVNERRRRDVGPYTRHGAGPYTGVAFCARCGASMYRHHQRYLFCGSRHRTYGRELCHSNHMPERKVTEAITGFLEWLATEENLAAALEIWTAGPGEDLLSEDLARARHLIEAVGAQRRRLGLALAAGKLDFDLYRDLDDGLLAKLAAEEHRALTLAEALEALPDIEERRALLQNLAGSFSGLIEKADPETVAVLLQNAGLRVFCEEGEVVEVRLG